MRYIDTFFNIIMDICVLLAKILLVGMTALVCVSVFSRYVLNRGLKWSDEVSMLLMVYFGFISIAYGVKEHLHLSVELFFNMFPAKLQALCARATMIIVVLLGCMMTVFGVKLVQSTMNNVMTSTRWPSATLYAVVPVSGALIAYYAFTEVIGYHSVYKERVRECHE